MSEVTASSAMLIDLPDELSAKAHQVPGLTSRLVHFIRMEVAMNERRQARYSSGAQTLVEKARDLAAANKAQGKDRATALAEFRANYDEIVKAL